jgi:hypothetical protein
VGWFYIIIRIRSVVVIGFCMFASIIDTVRRVIVVGSFIFASIVYCYCCCQKDRRCLIDINPSVVDDRHDQ